MSSMRLRSSALTAGLAYKPVMPRPIKAGVLGMARTMRWLRNQEAMLSVLMPAATLRCKACAVCGAVWEAASAKI